MIDFKKMLAQEPEFKRFCEEALLPPMLHTAPDLFNFLYSMYSIGNTSKDAAEVLKQMMIINPPKAKDE